MQIINYIKKNYAKILWRDVPNIALWGYLVLTAIFYALVTAYFPTQNGDNIEHIHSSFLVATGHVPYRDFFQHHNPLLWYLFAPLTKIFSYDTTIAEISCLISLLVFLKSLTYVYRIGAEFFESKAGALIAAAMVVAPGAKFYAIDLRPDNYMTCCFVAGLYYYFKYLRDKRGGDLTSAFFLFYLSFMFAQKALFPLVVLGLSGLYFWRIKAIDTKDMLKALILPFLGCLGFLFYLYHYDIIKLYFVSNYAFNLNLADGFEMSKVVPMPLYMRVLMIFGWCGCVFGFFSFNRYLGVVIALFISEFLQRMFYFSPYSYYYWILCYFAALCAVPVWKFLDVKIIFFKMLSVIYFGWLLWCATHMAYQLYLTDSNERYLPDYVTRRINPCDYVFNGDGMMYNIFGKDPAYYWQLIGQLDVVGEKTGIAQRPDMNALILRYLPKFVFGHSYFNKFSDESGRKDIVHYINPVLIDKYYQPTEFFPIFELKKEFDNRECRYDLGSHEWRYVE